MGKPTDWSLEGEPPEAADMPSPSPEETEAIQEEVQKVKDEDRKKIDDAVERGRSKAHKDDSTDNGKASSKSTRPDDESSSATSRPTGQHTTVDPGAS